MLAAALAAASVAAHAKTPSKPFFTFDDVAAGSTANSALGTLVSKFRFSDNVLVNSDLPANAFSVDNVIGSGDDPILLSFASPVNIVRFSIAQDLSGLGDPTPKGRHLAFLEATGHEIAGANLYYGTQEIDKWICPCHCPSNVPS